MTDHDDLEHTLRRFRHEPADRVRRAVLDAGFARSPQPWWRRPVPLYAVAALLAVAVGLSVTVVRGGRGPAGGEAGTPAAAEALPWTVADCDQL